MGDDLSSNRKLNAMLNLGFGANAETELVEAKEAWPSLSSIYNRVRSYWTPDAPPGKPPALISIYATPPLYVKLRCRKDGADLDRVVVVDLDRKIAKVTFAYLLGGAWACQDGTMVRDTPDDEERPITHHDVCVLIAGGQLEYLRLDERDGDEVIEHQLAVRTVAVDELVLSGVSPTNPEIHVNVTVE